jgi:hypothetical protein
VEGQQVLSYAVLPLQFADLQSKLAGALLDRLFEVGVELGQVAGEAVPFEMSSNTGKDLPFLEGLDDVVHASRIESLNHTPDIVAGGEKDNRDSPRGRVGLKAPAGLEAVDAGHHDVEEDKIGLGAGGDLQSTLPVIGYQDLVTGVFKRVEEDIQIGGDIIYGEDSGTGQIYV